MAQPVPDSIHDKVLIAAITSDQTRVWLMHSDGYEPVMTVEHDHRGNRHRRAVLESRSNSSGTEDDAYLDDVASVLALGSRLVLVGHGHGRSDLVRRLVERLEGHHPAVLEKVELVRHVDLSAVTNARLLSDLRREWQHR